MRLAYMPDTHFGHYAQPDLPGREDVADAMDQILREAERAEAVGFDGIWVPERHQRTETYWPSTISLLMALAARTRRVKLATTVMMPTFHHPVQVSPDWICIHIRTPQDGRGYHPGFAEALECIEQFGEVLDAVPTES